MRLLFSIALLLFSTTLSSQNLMKVGGKNRVEFQGWKFRPGQASKKLCANCEAAKQHFLKAKKIRSWNIVLAHLGFAEIIIGLLALDDEISKGIVNASIGGGSFLVVEERKRRIQIEINEGVKDFNRCQLLN